MTTEPEAPPVINGIVACGTCDNVFRAHPGRQSCPTCGGDPGYMIIDYSESPAGDSSGPAATSEESPAEPAAPEAPTPVGNVPSPDGPSAGPGSDSGGAGREEPAPTATGSSRRRSKR
jgi:hypothetical protein